VAYHQVLSLSGEHATTAEIFSVRLDALSEDSLAEEGLLICENYEDYVKTRYGDVGRLKQKRKTRGLWQRDYERIDKGPAETEPEFFVRVLLHGEEAEASEFHEEAARPLKSNEYLPGERLPLQAHAALVERVGQETVRKVLSRRRHRKPFATQISTSMKERLMGAREEEFREDGDSDAWGTVPWYLYDKLARESDKMDWVNHPDLLSVWLTGGKL
jgi:hypothetical protein